MNTSEPLQNHVKQITLGIRFQRQFKIGDITGEIVDTINHHPKSPFPKNHFPRIGEMQLRGKVLVHKNEREKLTVNSDDIIYQHCLEGDDTFEKSFTWVTDRYFPFLKEHVLRRFRINDLMRIGIVTEYELHGEQLVKTIPKSITDGALAAADTLQLRFTKKVNLNEAFHKRGVNDYGNVILTLSCEPPAKTVVDIDIQHFFDPVLEDVKDFEFQEFFKAAQKKLLNEDQPLVQKILSVGGELNG